MTYTSTGSALVEMVVVLALMAAVAAIAFAPQWGSAVVRDAATVATRLRMVRMSAILEARPGQDQYCLEQAPTGLTAVVAWPRNGIGFDGTGLPRTCAGGFGNTTITLEHRGERAAVIVSALGRVRWERQ